MVNTKIDKRKIYIVAIILIVVAQLLTYIYWMNKKSNFYVDELLSMSYSRVYGTDTPTTQYVQSSPDWKNGEWILGYDLRKYYYLNDETDFFPTSVSRLSKAFGTSRLYFMLLNLVRTISGNYGISRYPGLGLNLVILVLCDLLLVCISKELKMRPVFSALMLGMFGFSSLIISFVEFTRFYLLTELFLLMLFLSVALFRKSKTLWAGILLDIWAGLCIFIGMKNSELMVVVGTALFGLLVIDLILRKEWKKLIIHLSLLGIAFLYLLFKTSFIRMLLHPGNYTGDYGIGASIFNHLMDISLRSIGEMSIFMLDIFSRNLFNGMPVLVLWVAAITVFVILIGRNGDKKRQLQMPASYVILWVVWGTLSFLSLFVIRFRLLMIVGFMIYSIWMFFPLVRSKIKELKLSEEDGMVVLIAGTCLVYVAFMLLSYLENYRYGSYAMVSFMIFFWYLLDRGYEKLSLSEKGKKIFCTVLLLLCGVTFIFPFVTGDIEYIYENDAGLVKSVSEYMDGNPNADVVLMTRYKELQGDALDCIWQIRDDSRVYIDDYEELEYRKGIYPDRYLLWTANFRDMEPFFEEAEKEGYSYSVIGEDHVSRVYEVKK